MGDNVVGIGSYIVGIVAGTEENAVKLNLINTVSIRACSLEAITNSLLKFSSVDQI
jgi:hypothetical protein